MERICALATTIILLILLVPQGECIECFVCSSKNNTDCLQPYRGGRVPLTQCNLEQADVTKKYAKELHPSFERVFHMDITSQEPQVPMNCIKQVTRVGSFDVVLRGCQLASTETQNICDQVKRNVPIDSIQTQHCSLCNSDACNSANYGKAQLTTFLTIGMISIATWWI